MVPNEESASKKTGPQDTVSKLGETMYKMYVQNTCSSDYSANLHLI